MFEPTSLITLHGLDTRELDRESIPSRTTNSARRTGPGATHVSRTPKASPGAREKLSLSFVIIYEAASRRGASRGLLLDTLAIQSVLDGPMQPHGLQLDVLLAHRYAHTARG